VENSNQISIRPVLPAEVSQLAYLARQAYLDHYRFLWHDEGNWYAHISFSPPVLQEEYADPSNHFFFALCKGTPVGFMKLIMDFSAEPANSKTLHLERIYLLARSVRMGIGSLLVEFAINFALEKGMDTIRLKAMDSSRDSIAFYKKHGFRICGSERLDYPLMKENFRGMVQMQKMLVGTVI
jgi:GNAT superfamily N-acetyltransferase